MRHRRPLIGGLATAVTTFVLAAGLTSAAQTFPDPFNGDGLHVDIGSGSQNADIGDAFFLRDGDTLSIRMFLDPPNVFIESHVCLSATPFTGRIPPGQCQFQAQGVVAGSYDIGLPPSSFPSGTVPFDDSLGPFCAQVHVKYDRPGLARTTAGGGSAFAGWQPGQPFYGNVCFGEAPPDPQPGTIDIAKDGAVVEGEVIFTVTVTNPTADVAPNVVVIDALPADLEWTLPSECTFDPAEPIARCELGDVEAGAIIPLDFTATPAADECGAFTNYAAAHVDGDSEPTAAAAAAVDVPCPPDPPPDPLILLTKEPSASSVETPGTITYIVAFENAGPGTATNVSATDELPSGPMWSIGSGSNVCTLNVNVLSCFAETVPDGVFEVLEITGTLGPTDCGTLSNEATVEFEGGSEPGSVTAVAPPVEVTGCSAVTPAPTPTPAQPQPPSPGPSEDSGEAGEGGEGGEGGEDGIGGDDGADGELPDTRIAPASESLPGLLVAFLLAIAALSPPFVTGRRRLPGRPMARPRR